MGALYGQQSTISSESWGRMASQDVDIIASAGYSGEIILLKWNSPFVTQDQ